MRRPTTRLLAALAMLWASPILLLIGCQVMRSITGAGRPSFSHRTHVVEKKLDCESCHGEARTGDRAGMPEGETCEPCHGEKDKEKPPEARAAAFIRPAGAAAYPSEVKFSHRAHAEKGVACGECHRGIEDSTRSGTVSHLAMRDCTECHAHRGAPNDCADCHLSIRRDVAPGDHRQSWTGLHGQAARSGREARERCALCHTEEACAHCHEENPPKNHTNFWRIRGHGIQAEADRDTCRACHQVDFCDRCHREVAPRSHVGAWGSPSERHCLSCHLPLRAERSCALCHGNAAGHLLAAPKPSWHSAAMNCRQCHGAGQPLPHADNGSDCNACHR